MQQKSRHEMRLEKNRQKKIEKEEKMRQEAEQKRKSKLTNYVMVGMALVVVVLFVYNSGRSASAYYPTADDDPAMGPPDAPIEIIAFGDMSCPFTKKWATETMGPLLKKYGGKVRLVYRDYPKYDKHPQAQKAAEAAECAGEQGRYWEYFDVLFDRQGAQGTQDLKRYAEELGLNTQGFNECLDSQRYKDEVVKDHKDGDRAGVTTTPTFFINGNMIEGAQDLSAFENVIGQLMG